MKLLLALFKYFPSGGPQKDTLCIAEEAIRRGHDVTLLTTSWDGPPPPNGLEIIRCSVHGLNNHRRMDVSHIIFCESRINAIMTSRSP